MIAIVLPNNHFAVVQAASATAGLNEFGSSNFDLAIVDIFLEGTNGIDIIRKMRKRLPAFPIITISGMTTLDFVSNAPELFNVICLQRSLRPAELVRAVDAATAPRPPGAAEMRAAGTAAS